MLRAFGSEPHPLRVLLAGDRQVQLALSRILAEQPESHPQALAQRGAVRRLRGRRPAKVEPAHGHHMARGAARRVLGRRHVQHQQVQRQRTVRAEQLHASDHLRADGARMGFELGRRQGAVAVVIHVVQGRDRQGHHQVGRPVEQVQGALVGLDQMGLRCRGQQAPGPQQRPPRCDPHGPSKRAARPQLQNCPFTQRCR